LPWRAVSTTSTLEWERQPEEKGMAMNRRGGGGVCCSLLMAILLTASPAEPRPRRNDESGRGRGAALPLVDLLVEQAEQIAGQVARLYSSGKAALGPHASARAAGSTHYCPRRPTTGRRSGWLQCSAVHGGREASRIRGMEYL